MQVRWGVVQSAHDELLKSLDTGDAQAAQMLQPVLDGLAAAMERTRNPVRVGDVNFRRSTLTTAIRQLDYVEAFLAGTGRTLPGPALECRQILRDEIEYVRAQSRG